jgi:gluconate kinase
MLVKLFVLGRPGCGKSKTVQEIAKFIESEGWVSHHFKDYDILERMFQEDVLHRFEPFDYESIDVHGQPTTYTGFNVIDRLVLDKALEVLESNIHQHTFNVEENVLIVIEFARDDYNWALQQFSQDFLQGAHFILIDTDLETCKKRIHERVTHYVTSDDHFVSDSVLDTHYFNQYLPKNKLIRKRLTVVKNQDSWQKFTKKIRRILRKRLKFGKNQSLWQPFTRKLQRILNDVMNIHLHIFLFENTSLDTTYLHLLC